MKFVGLALAILGICNLATSEYQPEIIPIQGGVSGRGTTTRYWDCCKPSCAWEENVNAGGMALASCAKDGVTPLSVHAMSGCGDDGVAYMCNNQTPYVVNSTLAYGYAGASFTGGVDYHMCCACVLARFQGELAGKMMLLQLTNTGSDAPVNHFDIAIPGGGVGIMTRGCSSQWNAPEYGWGDRYGGVSSESGCDELPTPLRNACRFRFEFMQGVSNPDVTFYQVKCPDEIVAVTGCDR